MAEDDHPSGNNQSPKPPRPRYHKRARQGPNWLRTLRSLPREVLNACGRRLLNGESALDVAQWLFEQPHRGGCAHLSVNTLRVYLSGLRAAMRKADPDGRKRFERRLRDTAKEIHREQVHNDNVIVIDEAVAGASDPAKASAPPSAAHTAGGGFEQKMESIEAQVSQLLTNGIRVEEFLVYDLLINRERLRIALKMESSVGVVLKDNTAIVFADAKLLGLLLKAQSDSKDKKADWERPAAIEKKIDAESEPSALTATVEQDDAESSEMRQFAETARRLTPAEYDAATRVSPLFNELLDLVCDEVQETDEEGNSATDEEA